MNSANLDNRPVGYNIVTLGHEFGHGIGLLDLYSDSNANKLMYGYGNPSRTTTTPHSRDVDGAKEATKN